MSVLTKVDVTGTQKYIFGTNKLRENIGASEIVAQATSKWVYEIVRLENVIYCGGGNALLLFNNLATAKDFAKAYTKKLLQDAPNLDVVLTHSQEFGFESADANYKRLQEVVDETVQKLNEKKENRRISAPLIGLAVSAQCVSTGGVANVFDQKSAKYISAESSAKLDKADDANSRLEADVFANLEKYTWSTLALEVPLDFDDLGRTRGEASFIAVVHTDGNGMRNRVKASGELATSNQDWVEKVRAFSDSIKKQNTAALQKTIEFLLENLNEDHSAIISANGETIELIQCEKDKTKLSLPLRPLIFGGDDLTFVCDARIALDLTIFYLRELEKLSLSDGKPLYARAGIAIVKSHYPFSRAYELAEDLAKSAKERIKNIDDANKEVYAIDWQVAMSGLFGSIEEIRNREYKTPQGGKLNMRPLSLKRDENDDEWQTWEVFESIIKAFQGHDKNKTKEEDEKSSWREKRNKVKAFREALRGGDKKVEEFLTLYKLIEKKADGTVESKMPKVPSRVQSIETTGWHGRTCGYFDAIEMLDLYFPLKSGSESASTVKGGAAK